MAECKDIDYKDTEYGFMLYTSEKRYWLNQLKAGNITQERYDRIMDIVELSKPCLIK